MKSHISSPEALKILGSKKLVGVMLAQEKADKIRREFPNTVISDSNRIVKVCEEDEVALRRQIFVEKEPFVPEHERKIVVDRSITVRRAIVRTVTSAENNFSLAPIRQLVIAILKKAFFSQGCRSKEEFLQVLKDCNFAIQTYQASLATPAAGSSLKSDAYDDQQRTIQKEIEKFECDTDACIDKLARTQNVEEIREKDSTMDLEFVVKLFNFLVQTERSSTRLTRPYVESVTETDFRKIYEEARNCCSHFGTLFMTNENYYKEFEALEYNQVYEEALKNQDFLLVDGINIAFAEVVRKYGGGAFSINSSAKSPKVFLERAMRDHVSFKVHSMSQALKLLYEVSCILRDAETRSIALDDPRAFRREVAQVLSTARIAHQITSLMAEDAETCKVLETYAALLKRLHEAEAMTAEEVLEELLPPIPASSSVASEKSTECMQAPMNVCVLCGFWNSSCTLKLLRLIQLVVNCESEEKSCALREEVVKRLSVTFLHSDGIRKNFFKLIKYADRLKPSLYNKVILYDTSLVKNTGKMHSRCETAYKEFKFWQKREQKGRRIFSTGKREFCQAVASFAKTTNLTSIKDSTSEDFMPYDENLFSLDHSERIKNCIREGDRIIEQFSKITYEEIVKELEHIYEEHVKMGAKLWSVDQKKERMKELEPLNRRS